MRDDTTEAREFLREFVGAGPTIESRYETWFRIIPCMIAYAATVRRETREECARVADDYNTGWGGPEDDVADNIAAAIRRLGSDGEVG